jgi:hypothetical protein
MFREIMGGQTGLPPVFLRARPVAPAPGDSLLEGFCFSRNPADRVPLVGFRHAHPEPAGMPVAACIAREEPAASVEVFYTCDPAGATKNSNLLYLQ